MRGSAAKVRSRRIVEIPANAVTWLAPYAVKGTPIHPPNTRKNLEAIRDAAGLVTWKYDIMRHTALSARLAEGRSEGEVATWAGNSPEELHKRYKGLMTRKQAETFWSIRPEENTVVQFEANAG